MFCKKWSKLPSSVSRTCFIPWSLHIHRRSFFILFSFWRNRQTSGFVPSWSWRFSWRSWPSLHRSTWTRPRWMWGCWGCFRSFTFLEWLWRAYTPLPWSQQFPSIMFNLFIDGPSRFQIFLARLQLILILHSTDFNIPQLCSTVLVDISYLIWVRIAVIVWVVKLWSFWWFQSVPFTGRDCLSLNLLWIYSFPLGRYKSTFQIFAVNWDSINVIVNWKNFVLSVNYVCGQWIISKEEIENTHVEHRQCHRRHSCW